MKKREIERLYHAANAAWRSGITSGENAAPRAAPDRVPDPHMGATARDRAVELARLKGCEHAGGERLWEMPPSVWALVLAEAQRPESARESRP